MTDELVDLRDRVLSGEDVPAEEMAKVVENLRHNRQANTSKQKGSGQSDNKQVSQEKAKKILDEKV